MVKKSTKFAVHWRRSGLGLRLVIFAAALALFLVLIIMQQQGQQSADGGGSFLIYSLVNINVILLLVFAFLIGRNIVKLVFDRRRNIFGSKLRSRLVGAFISLVIIPSIFIFLFASGLITRAMEGWFSEPVEIAITGAVDIAKTHFQVSKRYLQAISGQALDVIKFHGGNNSAKAIPAENRQKLSNELESLRKNWGLFSIRILKADASIEFEVLNPASTIENFSEPPLKAQTFSELPRPVSLVQLEEKESRQFLRSYSSMQFNGDERIVVCTLRISPEMTQMMESVNNSYRRYEELKFYKGPIKFSNILTLALFTTLLLFSAIWLAFYLARDLTGPIMRLAEATRFVAQGRYDFKLREQGDDELGLLVKSFNQMTSEIKSAQQQSEERRLHLETVLSSLAVSVISLDKELNVLALNFPATRMLGLATNDRVKGKNIWEIVPLGFRSALKSLFDNDAEEYSSEKGFVLEKQFTFDVNGQKMEILATIARTHDLHKQLSGYVLLFDDLTELTKAQQFVAWKEVAQRVAHEIKNPLTPIQLSAQRLERLIGTASLSNEVNLKLKDCTQAILENVDSIKRLANEFSRFARMPRAEFEPTDLNRLISDTIEPYANGNPNVVFQFIAGSALPELRIDREQIRRSVINLIENALEALKNDKDNHTPRIVVLSNFDFLKKRISFEVQDNGPGVKEEMKSRVFEPYVSTKAEGGGLGLAIVASIVADHEGSFKLIDNQPRGARFIIELPIHPSQSTLRRFGT